MAAAEAVKKDSLSSLEKKWKHALDDGFTALPNVIFKHQKELELTHLDILIILHLSSFWWEATNLPRPSKASIADALNVSARTVQRRIEEMEVKGYVRRIPQKAAVGDNLPNKYDLAGLVKKAAEIAQENVKQRAKRQEEDKQRITTPKVAKLKVVANN